MNLKKYIKSFVNEDDYPKIGIMSHEISGSRIDVDFCLICTGPGYTDRDNGAEFNVHKDCFVSVRYGGDLVFHYKDAKDAWKKCKDHVGTIIGSREKYKKYKEGMK